MPESRAAIVFITEISNHNLTTLDPKLKMAICSLQLADFAEAFWVAVGESRVCIPKPYRSEPKSKDTFFFCIFVC